MAGRLLGHRCRIAGLIVAAALGLPALGHAQTVEDLRGFSIEQLANVQISSVAKTSGRLSDAPAAIYVISHDDIIRAGATTIPEMLRLAPNLEVAQINATSYAISARGFNVGDNASLSNKLLVLIDGRSVYTPLFGGVYWDMQSVLPDNVERIEVISGPGAALWGSNAVNGVINIITRSSAETQGGVLTLDAGNLQRGASLQYGGRLGPDLTYRAHIEGSQFSAYQLSDGHAAEDRWAKPQGGFRLDWTPPDNTVSVQGDIFWAWEQPNERISGRDVTANWRHQFADGSSVQLLTYYDQATRYAPGGGGGFSLDTYDIEAQHNFTIGERNSIVWGAGERNFHYVIENTALQLIPSSQTLNLANVFGQDTISITDRVKLTLGLKLEDEPYVGLEVMPSIRASWKVVNSTLLWAAVSRAVRSPTPVDENLREFGGAVDFLNGSSGFRPENLIAYEVGTRVQLSPRASFSVSAFYDVYDHIRTIEIPPGGGLPLQFGNLMTGIIYGIEVWGRWQPTDWWQLTAGFNLQQEKLRFRPGASQIGGLAFAADDPSAQASLRSDINLGHGVTWDANLRYVGPLPHPAVPAYAEFNTRLAWAATERLEFSLAGYNLLHPQHIEFFEDGESDQIPRSFLAEARIRF